MRVFPRRGSEWRSRVYFWHASSLASPLLEIATAYRDGEIHVRK
jgi:hypothetical protein